MGELLVLPRHYVDWILFEERAEGGDVLTAMRRTIPDFVAGFTGSVKVVASHSTGGADTTPPTPITGPVAC